MAKIHKQGRDKVTRYTGIVVEIVPVPLCAGAKGLYRGNSYQVTRLWENVNCKSCISKAKR